MMNKPPAMLPPQNQPQAAPRPPGRAPLARGTKPAPDKREAFARAYTAGVLQRMAETLHPSHLRKKG